MAPSWASMASKLGPGELPWDPWALSWPLGLSLGRLATPFGTELAARTLQKPCFPLCFPLFFGTYAASFQLPLGLHFAPPVALFGEPLDPFWFPWPSIWALWDPISASGTLLGRPWASMWETTGPSGPQLWPLGGAHGSLAPARTSQGSILASVWAPPGSSDH